MVFVAPAIWFSLELGRGGSGRAGTIIHFFQMWKLGPP